MTLWAQIPAGAVQGNCVKQYLTSLAIRGLWPAQVAMVVTMTTVKNMRECQEEGAVMTLSKGEQMARTRDSLGSLESSGCIGRESRLYWKI